MQPRARASSRRTTILPRLGAGGTQRLKVVARTPLVWSDTTLTPAAAAPASNLSLNACWASADLEASTAAQPRNVTPSALLTSFDGCPATLMRFWTSRPGWLTMSSKSTVKTVVSTYDSQLGWGTSGARPEFSASVPPLMLDAVVAHRRRRRSSRQKDSPPSCGQNHDPAKNRPDCGASGAWC